MFARLRQWFDGAAGWLAWFIAEIIGAAADHRQWIQSSRARNLEMAFESGGWVLTLLAYLSLAWLAYSGWLNIDNGLAGRAYAVNGIRESQTALFAIFAASLLLPVALIGTWIAVGMVYNVIVALGRRLLARVAWPLIHPAILLALAAGLTLYRPFVEASLARGYLHVQAALEAATGRGPQLAIASPDVDGVTLPGAVGRARQKAMARFRCAEDAQPTEQCAPVAPDQ
jgi:hypothetical protein